MSSLEEELQTKSFSNEQIKANLNIMFTANQIHNQISASLKPFGISHEQYNVLRILRGKHPESMCQKDILNRMIARQSNLTLLIKKLRDKQLISVKKSVNDRREYEIKINKKGLQLIDRINKKTLLDATFINNLSVSEAFHLNALLDKLRGE